MEEKKNLDNWEAAEIKNKPDNSGEAIREEETNSRDAEKKLAESLILAQDERWRRA